MEIITKYYLLSTQIVIKWKKVPSLGIPNIKMEKIETLIVFGFQKMASVPIFFK
jgi:hypothetical protein